MNPKPAVELTYTEPDPADVRAKAERYAINRLNAQHSTGPRTEEGKARSSMNALTHGLSAADPVLPDEDREAFEKLVQDFVDEYQPQNATEIRLSRELASISWRLDRIPALEAALLASASDPIHLEKSIRTISGHGHRLHRQFFQTMDRLRALQDERRAQHERDLIDCAAVYKHHQSNGLPYQPADDGFVFSNQEIDAFLARKTREGMSKQEHYMLTTAPEMLAQTGKEPARGATMSK